jgi:ABC-2 type transport system ATP-binding protein
MDNKIDDNLAIKVEELTKKFPGTIAVDKTSFSVKKGEIFGFLGPNGAGKTTTINMLCTLLTPTSGQALVNGFDVVKQSQEVRRSIGIVFQETTLDNHLTVEENLYLHAKLYGLTKNQFRKKLYPVLKLLELEDKKFKTVQQLSGGTKRRVEMARVFIHEPQILFLDEPTVGLDAQTKNKI